MATAVIKEGFLVKKGHVRHNWRTRWFVLKTGNLSYFKKREDMTPAGVIPLVGAVLECPPLDASRKPWLLQVMTHESREYHIQAPDQATRDEWKQQIEECIRKLDPSKLGTDNSLTRTLSHDPSNKTAAEREIIQAMQDPSAGLKLYEFKAKGTRQATRYFSGKEALDWLVSWSFASSRSQAVTLATSMLNHGFFHPIRREEGKRSVTDSILGREIVDSEDSEYTFVVFSPGQSVGLFGSDDESDGSSDSEDDLLSTRAPFLNGVDVDDGRIIRQGFLLKKGHVLHNWKARKFVLREKAPYIYYYRGSKSEKPLGVIPLADLTVLELDNSECELPVGRRKTSRSRANRILLITMTGMRVVLEATTGDERNLWVTDLKVAVASQQISSP